MTRNRLFRVFVLAAAVLALVVVPGRASAHCDSMDGPVVRAARRALETNTVELALVWVQPSGEQEVRDAFTRAMRVRASGSDARELAELWFFETVVRVHRTGEGEPYTGLKPAGAEIPAGILAADRALERGSIDELAEELAGRAARLLTQRFQHVSELSAYDARDTAAGRRYVAAYVEYMHFVETLHALLTGEGGDHWSEHEEGR